jgi:hypothetical protein
VILGGSSADLDDHVGAVRAELGRPIPTIAASIAGESFRKRLVAVPPGWWTRVIA